MKHHQFFGHLKPQSALTFAYHNISIKPNMLKFDNFQTFKNSNGHFATSSPFQSNRLFLQNDSTIRSHSNEFDWSEQSFELQFKRFAHWIQISIIFLVYWVSFFLLLFLFRDWGYGRILFIDGSLSFKINALSRLNNNVMPIFYEISRILLSQILNSQSLSIWICGNDVCNS